MKKILFIGLFLLPFIGFAQERGVGIRLGEPFSITYRDFISDYISYEGMIGLAGVNSSSYYLRDFENNPPQDNAFHQNNSAKRGVSLNGRLAYNDDFSEAFGIEKGYLMGYAGLGLQFRTTNASYQYTLNQVNPDQPVQQEERTNVDFGGEVFLGVEYYFDETPISVFGEAGFFLELLDRVGHVKGQGGVGVRYIF